ncbi:MAG: enoyl-CoA hydratase/isomerase family protein [Marinicaulis sp.]|nr:enoyl-CoA hydratase/isomerase family protein [Marinicaulis sp.]
MIKLPDTAAIILERDGGWLTIWFNTPANRNALSDQLVSEVSATLDAVKDDRSIRGITLRGKGGVFCAGADLKAFQAGLSGTLTHESAMAINRGAGELFAKINNTPQVVVVLIEGAAIAGGLGLACCADVIAVTKDAKFSLTETQIGIPPAQIAPHVVRRVGMTTAREIMLTGARFKGDEAHEIGIANFLADDAAGLDAIEAKVREGVMRCAPGANALTKEILLAAPKLTSDEMLDFAANRFASAILSDEGREGIASFIEKRKPEWAE